MATRFSTPKITDLVTTLDSEIVQSASGPMAWGAVEIFYASEGLEPRLTIKVPVPVFETQSDEERRAEVIRRARKLIDHACMTMEPQLSASQRVAEVLEGFAEELGVLAPTSAPERTRDR
jgi:hypothetical protein